MTAAPRSPRSSQMPEPPRGAARSAVAPHLGGGLSATLARLLRVPLTPVPPEGSPGSLLVFRADRRWVTYKMVTWALSQAVAFVLSAGIALAMSMPMLMGKSSRLNFWVAALLLLAITLPVILWLAWAVLSWVSIRVDRELRWYMVTDHALRIREGIWQLREMTVTFANVQNVSVSQGPLQRYFGLADVVVQTAGGGGGGGAPDGSAAAGMHTAHLRGVADAEAVRDFIMARVRTAARDGGASAGLDDAVAAEPPAVLAALREVAAEAAALRAVAVRDTP